VRKPLRNSKGTVYIKLKTFYTDALWNIGKLISLFKTVLSKIYFTCYRFVKDRV